MHSRYNSSQTDVARTAKILQQGTPSNKEHGTRTPIGLHAGGAASSGHKAALGSYEKPRTQLNATTCRAPTETISRLVATSNATDGRLHGIVGHKSSYAWVASVRTPSQIRAPFKVPVPSHVLIPLLVFGYIPSLTKTFPHPEHISGSGSDRYTFSHILVFAWPSEARGNHADFREGRLIRTRCEGSRCRRPRCFVASSWR